MVKALGVSGYKQHRDFSTYEPVFKQLDGNISLASYAKHMYTIIFVRNNDLNFIYIFYPNFNASFFNKLLQSGLKSGPSLTNYYKS